MLEEVRGGGERRGEEVGGGGRRWEEVGGDGREWVRRAGGGIMRGSGRGGEFRQCKLLRAKGRGGRGRKLKTRRGEMDSGGGELKRQTEVITSYQHLVPLQLPRSLEMGGGWSKSAKNKDNWLVEGAAKFQLEIESGKDIEGEGRGGEEGGREGGRSSAG